MRRAVITGVGVVSPYGCGVEQFWTALAAAESAIRPIRTFDARSFPTQVAGEVPDLSLDAAWLLGALADLHITAPAELPTQALAWQDAGCFRDRKIGLALLAALQAWQQAGCGPDEQTAWLSIGLGLEHALLADFVPLLASPSGAPRAQLAWDEASQRGLPATRFRTRVDLAADLIASGLGLRGPRLVNCSACAAGTLAVAQAAALIERGRTDLVLCGAADSMINPLGVGGMSRLGACSPRQAADACRPFDIRRDGLVIGEGAALFVLEDEARARARGARPLARVLGWGSTQDAYRATAPRPDGSAAAQAIGRALQRAGLSPQHVDYINAHGTGTPLNDPAEVLAIRAALGSAADTVAVSSIKGAIGHLMAAAGAVELAACLLPFERDLLPGTAHHQQPDPACALDIIGEQPRPARVDHVLSNSFGFGGQNASLILGRAT